MSKFVKAISYGSNHLDPPHEKEGKNTVVSELEKQKFNHKPLTTF